MVELVGVKVAVTPVGTPDAEKATLPVKPPDGVTVITLLPAAPLFTVKLAGDAESVKFAPPVPVMVRLIVVVAVSAPEVPIIVTVDVPVVAVALAVNVTTLDVAEDVGLKAAVTPVGKPLAENVTVPLKPFFGVTVIVLDILEPCAMLKLLGDAPSVKLGLVETGQAFTRFAALTVPIPVVKSQPVVAT